MRNRVLIAAVFLTLCGVLAWKTRTTVRPPDQGPPVPTAPQQEAINDYPPPVRQGAFLLRPRATYRLRARVLSRRDYFHDDIAGLAPLDLALGWQSMSDPRVLSAFTISQRERFDFVTYRGQPIPRETIVTESANVHVIPANARVREALRHVRAGQIIRMNGLLVDAKGPDGRLWRTSLSRSDSGPGACEMMYVQGVAIEPPMQAN